MSNDPVHDHPDMQWPLKKGERMGWNYRNFGPVQATGIILAIVFAAFWLLG